MSPDARRLEHRVDGVRRHLRRRAAVASTLWVGVGMGLVLVAAWLVSGAAGWRPGSNVPLVLDVLAVLCVVAGVAAFRSRVRRWFAEVPLASTIERAAGLRPGTVRGSLELAREVPPGTSSSLAGRAVHRAVVDLGNGRPSTLAGELGTRVSGWARRGLGVLSLLAITLVVLAVAAPARSAGAWSGLLAPFRTMVDPVLPPIDVEPGNVEVLRGTDLQLEIGAEGRLGVTLSWQAAGDVARSARLRVVEGRAAHVFRGVNAPMEYSVRGDDGAVTETFHVTPVDPLFVSDLVVEVAYPSYTGLPPDEYRGDPPPLRLPVGTRLTFEGSASRPLTSVALMDSAGSSALGFAVEQTAFRAGWTPTRDGIYSWAFRDLTGAAAEIQPAPLRIELVPDSAPEVVIPLPGRDTILPLNLRQPLILEARDDYGLGRLELVAYRVTAFGERDEPVVQGLDLGGTRVAQARPLLDLSDWGLLPGDTVRYYARAVDNSPDQKAAVSREYVLRMPAAPELRREAEQTLDRVAERMEELAAEAARQAQENRDQARETGGQQSSGANERNEGAFEDREELQRALTDQEGLAGEVDSLQAQLEDLERMMQDAGQADPELSRELEELQELIRELTGDDLRARMEQLAEALEQGELGDANQSLEELAGEQEAFRDRLEESLERFRRAAVEQDFRATTSEAQELARQEQALADAMAEQDDPQLRARQQEELGQRAEQLESRMERLGERLGQLDEQQAAEGVEQARQTSSEAREEMERAREQATEGQSQAAGERAQEAAERMQEAAEQLQDAQQQMAEQKAQAAEDALMRTADDALALARRQAELREQMRGASQEQLAGMRGDEASLLQGVQNLADNLQLATEGAMSGNRELSAQVGRTLESLEETIEAMEGRRGSTPSPLAEAEQAVGELNQLALMAIASAEQLSQEGGEGESGEDLSEQLEQLAQEQGDLMNQSGQLMPMQLGQQAMSQQLQQLSQGQQSVAGDLGELADQPGSEQSLGDLQELAREAQALAQELSQGRLTPDMMRRQERLFHRLLDAGRSLEREEYSEERESERPGAFDRGLVMPLSSEQLGVMPYRLPDAEQLQSLSPAVRQLVLEYFERLNRGGTEPGGTR